MSIYLRPGRRRFWLVSPLSLSLLLLAAAPLSAQGEAAPASKPAATGEQKVKIEPAQKPFKLPEGAARAGWEALLKNDFAGAEAAFNLALLAEVQNLFALEGLRSAAITRGDYKAAQRVNLRMVAACTDPALAVIFSQRAMDMLSFVDSRAEILEAFTKAAAAASPPIASLLKDHCAALLEHAEKVEEAGKLLAGSGYVNQWQFVAGPFGSKDKGEVIEKRFAPERPLKSLEFTDETGKAVPVRKNVDAPRRVLNLDNLLHGPGSVFYAFTNLESDQDQEITLAVAAPSPYRVYLRGMPVIKEPGEEQFRRSGADLVRVRLLAGVNPLLVKMGSCGTLTVRVSGFDFAPLAGVRVKALADSELAVHEVSTARGFLLAEKISGLTAEYFLKLADKQNAPGTPGAQTDVSAPAAKQRLRALAEGGALTIPEAYWLDFALSRENDPRARVVLAHTLAGSAPDAVNVLDMAAYILNSAGVEMGDTEAREVEEARRWREHALALVPDSHQHLFALCSFFNQHKLAEQAFEKIKACAATHPSSATAMAELGRMYQQKRFMVEAEQCFEKAAALDNAYLPTLAWFHEFHGNRSRAKELRQKEIQLGLLNSGSQFEYALQSSDFGNAEHLLKQMEKEYPERAEEFTGKHIRWLTEKGELKQAYELQNKVYRAQASDHPEKRGTLMALLDLGQRVGEDAQVKELLRAYLKENPGDYECRQRLLEMEEKQLPRWWEAYDVKVSEIDTSSFTNQKYPLANHAWIVDFMATRILPDLSQESYVHIAQKVLNTKGISELSELLVQAQRNEIVFICTLNPDGSSYFPQNVHNFNLSQTASLYKVGPGSILEHAYLAHADADKDEPALNLAFNFNAIDAPRAVSRWVVMIADEARAKLKIRKICPEMVDEQVLDGPAGYTVYQWTNKQVEGIKREDWMPLEADQEVIPLVLIETPPPAFHAESLLTQHQQVYIPPEAAAQAGQIVAALPPGAGDEDKFMAIVKWVREHIHPGTDSRTLDDVWFVKTGNAWQRTWLAREMAHAAGLNASLAEVNESYQPGKVWRSKNAPRQWEPAQLVGFGQQMLVLQQPHAPDRWVQFLGRTPDYYSLSDVQPNESGSLALVRTDAGPRLKRVNGEEMGVAPAQQNLEVVLDNKGAAKVNASIEVFGKAAGDFRESLADPRIRPRIEEGLARSSWPKLQAPKVQIQGDKHAGTPVSVSYTGSVESLANCENGAFFLPPFTHPPQLLRLFGAPERQHDLLIRQEFAELDHTLAYTCPEGYAWTEVPNGLCMATEFGFFLANYSVRGRVLNCTRSFLMPAQRILPEKYPLFQNFLKQIAGNQRQRIAYAPLKSESFGPHIQEILSNGYVNSGEIKPVSEPQP